MRENIFFRQLERAWIYRLAQWVLAPNADRYLLSEIERLLGILPPAEQILDVGCGPASWLWQKGLQPIGLDISMAYSTAFHKRANLAINASADLLPFLSQSMDAVWSIGLLHHLSDQSAIQAICEMLRVCRNGGSVVVLDAVLPRSAWRRPLAHAIRKMDRGRFVRGQFDFEALLPDRARWMVNRCPYSINGLEILTCWQNKITNNEPLQGERS